MPTRRSVLRSRAPQVSARSLWARTEGNLLLNDPGQLIWLGSDTLAGVLGSTTAEALPVVTRATALITGPLTAAPFRVQQAGAGAQLPAPRFLADPMLARPDNRYLTPDTVHPAVSRLTRSEFWTGLLRAAIWWGAGAFAYQEDAEGQPLAGTMMLLHPLMLSTERCNGGTGFLRWVLGTGPDAVRFDRNGYADVGPVRYRLVVLRNPHSPVDTEGLSKGVFAMSPDAFGLAGQVDTFARGTFRSGVPAGYLRVTGSGLTQPQADQLKASWMAAHGGDRRSIAVLNASTEFTPISMSPVDAELAAMKRLAVADVAFAFGLDPMTLGVSLANSATYTNIRDAWQNHRDFGLSPWISALQDLLSSLLPGDRTVSVALDSFANPPASERYAAYKTAIDAGILTADEARALEGMPPLVPDSGTPHVLIDEPPPPTEQGEPDAA